MVLVDNDGNIIFANRFRPFPAVQTANHAPFLDLTDGLNHPHVLRWPHLHAKKIRKIKTSLIRADGSEFRYV